MLVTAVNASPRTNWNTAQLVKSAAEGAQTAGAEIKYFDLYKQDSFTGCLSCFSCKRPPNEGYCVCQDGITPILESIRMSDAIILGTPNYLVQASAGFRALYERLIFQNRTYKPEPLYYHRPGTPVLFIMTSNIPAEAYESGPYADMISEYRQRFSESIGTTEIFISGDTLQVSDYSLYNWTSFDPVEKQNRHDKVFPLELARVHELGAKLLVR